MKIRELLSDEGKWTKGAYARNANGEDCYASSPDAVCWCLDGAAMKCYTTLEYNNICGILNRATKQRFHCGYISWQDAPERTFAEVKALVEELDI